MKNKIHYTTFCNKVKYNTKDLQYWKDRVEIWNSTEDKLVDYYSELLIKGFESVNQFPEVKIITFVDIFDQLDYFNKFYINLSKSYLMI